VGALTFTYTHAERVERTCPPPTDTWSGGTDARPVGDASLVILNVEPGQDVRELADPAAGDWRTITAALAAEASGATAGPADHLLVLERVRVEPEHRGHGLGPLIATAVIERLGRGCRMAACFPASFEGPCRPEDHDFEVEALSRIWAKVGFRHWRNGVWMMELAGAARMSVDHF